MPKKLKQWGTLILFIAICQGAGAIGSLFTFASLSTWFVTLAQPSFAPPNWVFGPVWTILYTLMGIALYIVWQKRGISPIRAQARTRGVRLFWIHLFFNALWSILFFGVQSPLYALIDIVVLWVLLVATTFYFFRVSTWAGVIMLPYLAWVSFASVLNAAIVFLN